MRVRLHILKIIRNFVRNFVNVRKVQEKHKQKYLMNIK